MISRNERKGIVAVNPKGGTRRKGPRNVYRIRYSFASFDILLREASSIPLKITGIRTWARTITSHVSVRNRASNDILATKMAATFPPLRNYSTSATFPTAIRRCSPPIERERIRIGQVYHRRRNSQECSLLRVEREIPL